MAVFSDRNCGRFFIDFCFWNSLLIRVMKVFFSRLTDRYVGYVEITLPLDC